MTAIPWSPRVPETSTRSPGCTRSGPRMTPGGDLADTGGVHVEPVCLSPLDDLRVSGRDRDARRRVPPAPSRPRRAGGRRPRNPPRRRSPAERYERPRTGDGEVVDRPVDGELADRAAREEDRRDDVGVGREREPRARSARSRRSRRARSSSGLPNSSRKSPSTSALVALPPAPWASVTISSRSFGRRARVTRARGRAGARAARSCSRPRRRPRSRPCRCRSGARACRRSRTRGTPRA